MALEIGAATEGLGTCLLCGPFFPGSVYTLAVAVESNTVWINSEGRRYTDESSERPSENANALNRQPGQISFTLFDNNIKNHFIEEGLLKGALRSYPPTTKMTQLEKRLQVEYSKGRIMISKSLDKIASWIGADSKVLKKTVNDYNSFCDMGCDKMLGKDSQYLYPVRKPPYYAIKCYQGSHGTIGGIKINHHMEVINLQGKPIPGLFAAGNDTGGWESDTYCYVLSGTALAYAINSGRIAGESAVNYLNQKA